jgi:hypothetical protein
VSNAVFRISRKDAQKAQENLFYASLARTRRLRVLTRVHGALFCGNKVFQI